MPAAETYLPRGQCCPLDEPYEAPAGYFDQPFIYVYDPAAGELVNGRDYRYLAVTTFSGADFLLRRIAGQDRCAASLQYRDVLQRLGFQTPASTNYRDFPIIPEMLFPAATGITFDLFNVAKAVHTSGEDSVELAQLVFAGARRFRGSRRPPSYRYFEDEFNYVVRVDMDFLPTAAARRFAIDVWDFDFELLEIYRTQVSGATMTTPPAKILLQDQVYEPVSSRPLVDDLLIANSSRYQGALAPGIVYRRGQQIRFDLLSLVLAGDMPATFEYRFHGVRRRPC